MLHKSMYTTHTHTLHTNLKNLQFYYQDFMLFYWIWNRKKWDNAYLKKKLGCNQVFGAGGHPTWQNVENNEGRDHQLE